MELREKTNLDFGESGAKRQSFSKSQKSADARINSEN
jgi:hypothetical protein